MVQANNCRAAAVVPYAAGIVEWTKEELLIMDRKMHKRMTLHHALHPHAYFGSFSLQASGARGLMSIEDSVIMRLIVLAGMLIVVKVSCWRLCTRKNTGMNAFC